MRGTKVSLREASAAAGLEYGTVYNWVRRGWFCLDHEDIQPFGRNGTLWIGLTSQGRLRAVAAMIAAGVETQTSCRIMFDSNARMIVENVKRAVDAALPESVSLAQLRAMVERVDRATAEIAEMQRYFA